MIWHGFRDLPRLSHPSLPEGRFVCGTDTVDEQSVCLTVGRQRNRCIRDRGGKGR